jgi:hypothetical protein
LTRSLRHRCPRRRVSRRQKFVDIVPAIDWNPFSSDSGSGRYPNRGYLRFNDEAVGFEAKKLFNDAEVFYESDHGRRKHDTERCGWSLYANRSEEARRSYLSMKTEKLGKIKWEHIKLRQQAETETVDLSYLKPTLPIRRARRPPRHVRCVSFGNR